MKLTRRKLAGVLAATPVAGALLSNRAAAQTSAAPDEETTSAREALRNNLAQIVKVKLDRALEPATKFRA